MLSKFTMSKICEEPEAFNDIISHYENVMGYNFKNTDAISGVIEGAYRHGGIIYVDQIKNDRDFVEFFNERFGKKYKTIDEINYHETIDLIRGDKIYSIIW